MHLILPNTTPLICFLCSYILRHFICTNPERGTKASQGKVVYCDVLSLFSLFISIPFVFSVSCFILYTLCPGMWFQLLGCSLPVVVIVFPSSSCVSPVANYPCLPCASIYPSVFVGSYWFLLVPILVSTRSNTGFNPVPLMVCLASAVPISFSARTLCVPRASCSCRDSPPVPR